MVRVLTLYCLAPRFFKWVMIQTWGQVWSWRIGVFVESTPSLISSWLTRSTCWQYKLIIVSPLSSFSWCTIPCVFNQTHSMTFYTNLSDFGFSCRTWSESNHCNSRSVLSNKIQFSSPVKIVPKMFHFFAMESIDLHVAIILMVFGQFKRNPPLALTDLSDVI